MYTHLFGASINSNYQLKCCGMIVEKCREIQNHCTFIDFNIWLPLLIRNICERVQTLILEILKNEQYCEELRFYQLKLIDLSKIFSHEKFLGCDMVLQTIKGLYKLQSNLKHHEKNKKSIVCNSIAGLLAVLQNIIGNPEVYKVTFSYLRLITKLLQICIDFQILVKNSEGSPKDSFQLIMDATEIVCKNASRKILKQYFFDNPEENLFLVVFRTSVKLDNLFQDRSRLYKIFTVLVQCLSIVTQQSETMKVVQNLLTVFLLSANIKIAYLGLNCWSLFARVLTSEMCFKYFKKIRDAFESYSIFDCSMQRYFLGKTMQIFYLCSKTKLKQKILQENPVMNNIKLWMTIKLNETTQKTTIDEVVNSITMSIMNFLSGKNDFTQENYHNMVSKNIYFSTIMQA